MPKQYTREQLWKLYQKLPKELQEAIFAGETAEHIGTICERYDIQEKTISEIAKQVGDVLLGILPPEDFQETLEKELKIEKDVAKKVAQEINRFIFYPVKPALEQLYKMEITPTEKIAEKPAIARPEIKPEMPEIEEEKPTRPAGKDIYREPIE